MNPIGQLIVWAPGATLVGGPQRPRETRLFAEALGDAHELLRRLTLPAEDQSHLRAPIVAALATRARAGARLVLVGTDQRASAPQRADGDTLPLAELLVDLLQAPGGGAEIAAAAVGLSALSVAVPSPVDVGVIAQNLAADEALAAVVEQADEVVFVHGGGPGPVQLGVALHLAGAARAITQWRVDAGRDGAPTVVRTVLASLPARISAAAAVRLTLDTALAAPAASNAALLLSCARGAQAGATPHARDLVLAALDADLLRQLRRPTPIAQIAAAAEAWPDSDTQIEQLTASPDAVRVLRAVRAERLAQAREIPAAVAELAHAGVAVDAHDLHPGRLRQRARAAAHRLDPDVAAVAQRLDARLRRRLSARLRRVGGSLSATTDAGRHVAVFVFGRALSDAPRPRELLALVRDAGGEQPIQELLIVGLRQPTSGDAGPPRKALPAEDTLKIAHALTATLSTGPPVPGLSPGARIEALELVSEPSDLDELAIQVAAALLGCRGGDVITVLQVGGAPAIVHAILAVSQWRGTTLRYLRTLEGAVEPAEVPLAALSERAGRERLIRTACAVARATRDPGVVAALARVVDRPEALAAADACAALQRGEVPHVASLLDGGAAGTLGDLAKVPSDVARSVRWWSLARQTADAADPVAARALAHAALSFLPPNVRPPVDVVAPAPDPAALDAVADAMFRPWGTACVTVATTDVVDELLSLAVDELTA